MIVVVPCRDRGVSQSWWSLSPVREAARAVRDSLALHKLQTPRAEPRPSRQDCSCREGWVPCSPVEVRGT